MISHKQHSEYSLTCTAQLPSVTNREGELVLTNRESLTSDWPYEKAKVLLGTPALRVPSARGISFLGDVQK